MYGGKWRVKITDEVWEFDTFEQFKQTIDGLLARKEEFGRLR